MFSSCWANISASARVSSSTTSMLYLNIGCGRSFLLSLSSGEVSSSFRFSAEYDSVAASLLLLFRVAGDVVVVVSVVDIAFVMLAVVVVCCRLVFASVVCSVLDFEF